MSELSYDLSHAAQVKDLKRQIRNFASYHQMNMHKAWKHHQKIAEIWIPESTYKVSGGFPKKTGDYYWPLLAAYSKCPHDACAACQKEANQPTSAAEGEIFVVMEKQLPWWSGLTTMFDTESKTLPQPGFVAEDFETYSPGFKHLTKSMFKYPGAKAEVAEEPVVDPETGELIHPMPF